MSVDADEPQLLDASSAPVRPLNLRGPVRLRLPEPRPAPIRVNKRLTRWLTPAWPLQVLLVGFPLWWALGIGSFIFQIVAVPMALQLVRRGGIRLPPGFWLWAMHLVWSVLGIGVFFANPPGLTAGDPTNRILALGLSFAQDAAITITLLYVTNLPRSISQWAVARWLGAFFLTVFAGGFLGLLAPGFTFTSPLERLLPQSLAGNTFVRSVVHPITAQVQGVVGTADARPAAPFGYTNDWGYAISVLGLWFLAAWLLPATRGRRVAYVLIALASFVPIVLSLNRGLWIGLVFAAAWMLGRQATQGKLGRVLAALLVVFVAGAVALLATPAGSVIAARLDNGDSNTIRGYVLEKSVEGMLHSPLIGYGGTRHTQGSAQSIAIGKSVQCPRCGEVATGSTGQLWAQLFNEGLLGTFFYFGFFAFSIWRFRRERGPVNEAALLTVALAFVYMFVYTSVPVGPTLTMIAIGLLARSAAEPAGPGPRAKTVDA